MSDRITQALSKLFESNRIVFWYDAKKELREDYEALELPGVEKLELCNNEFGVKYRILRQEPKQKFLLYREGPQPSDMGNWLLDVLLANAPFSTDQAAIWRAELDLGIEFTDLVNEHAEFFGAEKRRQALKRLLSANDTHGALSLKMLAVCAGADPRIDAVLESLLSELADDKSAGMDLIVRCGLDGFLWEQLKRHYGYVSAEAGIRDFVVELFKSCYAMGTEGEVRLTGDALVFLKRWKDSRTFSTAFETLSGECAEAIDLLKDLEKRDFRELVELDYFRLIDQKIVSDLVKAVGGRTVSTGEVMVWIRQRRQGHWYSEFRDLYEAIGVAAQFLQAMDETKVSVQSMSDGIQSYCQSWYRLDQLYRKFTYHVRMSKQPSLMGTLSGKVENLYSTNFLLKLNDLWQHAVDSISAWDASPIPMQRTFFERWVRPFPRQDKKVHVIISDALRYEVVDELLSLIRQEDRYDAELEPALSMLPSYTQLGMAALLPNKELALTDNDSGGVLVDGKSSQGTANRQKILNAGLPGKVGRALSADEFMSMPREGADGYRALFSDNDVVYIYHNRIDATGDKRDTEERVFEAVEEALQELVSIIKKLTTANATNLIVTADHGFIYQNSPIDESDFAGVEAKGDLILFKDRRFILGKGLKEQASLRTFTSAQLGLVGDVEIQIPKSINRLRLKGAGSRFVHGGASLQEVVVPVLKINKKRRSDLSQVEVEIIRGASPVISTGQIAVTLYQSTAATEKTRPRMLRAGIYTDEGELISDAHELSFDLTSENPREREMKVTFVLGREADSLNGKEVLLKLEEKHAGTSHYKEYRSLRYTIRRSFTTDFDL